MKTYTFHVSGLRCASCPVLTESELSEVPEVSKVTVSLRTNQAEVVGDFAGKTPEQIAEHLNRRLISHGYALSVLKNKHSPRWHEFSFAVPFAIGFVGLFILLQKLGIVNLITTGDVSYGTAFFVGLIASVSTCMAVVGGLVLSMSANFAKAGDKVRPQVLFHVGRLVSFFFLGGAIGVLGSAFTLGSIGALALGIVVGLVLLILGLNLLDIFPGFQKIQPSLPGALAGHIHRLKTLNHSLTPLLLGVVTFFLPCGFTQSMQIYALGAGSFSTGAFTMVAFALGTLPVLVLLSFGSLGIRDNVHSGIFFKTAGLVVIFFGFLNLWNSLAAAGIIPPLFGI